MRKGEVSASTHALHATAAGADGVALDGVALERVHRDAAPLLRNVLELYAHDFSEFVPMQIKPNGRFDLDIPDAWWRVEDHHVFLIRCADQLAGFAVVRKGSRVTGAADVMDVAEFFVLRAARRKRVGSRAAHVLFGLFPGQWEVRVRTSNVPALRFWTRAVEAWTARPVVPERVVTDSVAWDVLRTFDA